MNTQANKILNQIEEWSKSDRENRCAAVALSDKTTGNYYLHYAGNANDIGKCVHAIMDEDAETAFGIFAAGTIFTITNSFRGYTLSAPNAWVSRVPHDAVEFIDQQNPEPNEK